MTKPLDRHIIFKELIRHPNARTFADALLKAEQKRRQQFYEDITDAEKVEFINGEIIVHSPVMKEHNDASTLLSNLIGNYVGKNDLGYVGVEKIMITLERNDYEPDICFFNNEKAQHFKEGQSLFPAPDFIVEILSKGTKKNDRGIKFTDYAANGVTEYLLVDPKSKIIELYRLAKNRAYKLILKSGEGTLKSEVIKGFAIDITAIFNKEKNLTELLKILSK